MSVTVVFGTQRFKTPIKPQSPLSSVHNQVCEKLNLSNEDYGLFHGSKAVDLTLPWRLSGLVNNAQLELKRVPKQIDIDKPVRIKIKFSDKPDYLGSFSGARSIGQILADLGLHGELLLNNNAVDKKTLLGKLGTGLMFYFQGSSRSNPTSNPSKSSSSSHSRLHTENKTDSHAEPVQSVPRDARVVVVPKMSSSEQFATLNDSPAMSSNQFLTYMSHLKSQSEPPMLSKETKQKLANAQRTPIENTTCRIKFPDQNCLEGKFAQGETGEDVINFVSMYLENQNSKFELVSMKPHFVLTPEMLLSSALGQRALLMFRPVGSAQTTGFLNKKALKLLQNTPASKREETKETKDSKPPLLSKELGTSSAESAGPNDDPKSKKNSLKQKMPKWLKLRK